MIVKATISFAGENGMTINEQRDFPEGKALDDLLRAGYVVPCEQEKAAKNEDKRAKPKHG